MLPGSVIGLLQIPAFLIIETALGASSSYVTVGGVIASWIDPSILQIGYVARHVAATGKNWWQVALVAGVAIGAFTSMKLSGALRLPISPIWKRALGSASPSKRYAIAFIGGFVMLLGARIADGCTSGHGAFRNGTLGGWLDRCGRRHVCGWHRRCHAAAAPHMTRTI